MAVSRLPPSSTTREDQGLLKMDHQINAAHKLTGSLFLVRATVADPFASRRKSLITRSVAPTTTSATLWSAKTGSSIPPY